MNISIHIYSDETQSEVNNADVGQTITIRVRNSNNWPEFNFQSVPDRPSSL